MSDKAPVAGKGRAVAAAYLRQLLLKQGSYRRLWEQHVIRERPGEINQLAVAEVLARYLWSYPRHAGDADVMPRQLKDTVSRALSGRLLSRPTLSLFIEAFGIADSEADRLWRLFNGSESIAVLSGRRAVSPQVEHDLRAALGPRRHQTLSLHDHVEIGADGLLARTRTMQVIEALEPGTDSIPYLYDTATLTLDVGQGCQGVSRQLYKIGDSVYCTSIILAAVLDPGQTSTLEYWTTYNYQADPQDPQLRQYRRAVMRYLENFDMRVQFDAARLPAGLWWATWDGVDGEVLGQEPVSLDSQNSAHRYMRSIERTVVGFYWTW
ncbi:MAG TPA: hypothetical protein VFV41_15625 [Streptosporangiaceae bacterium]|nr:hypothetical protein [Streptosporangiaceae bacterium]